jgi:hypothetical protein
LSKYQRHKRPGSLSEKKKTALIILCAPRQLGAHKMTKTSAASGSFLLILCMWSDPIGKPFRKKERCLIIDGIFVVVVVVLEAVGWMRGGYAHPVLDQFLSKMQFRRSTDTDPSL